MCRSLGGVVGVLGSELAVLGHLFGDAEEDLHSWRHVLGVERIGVGRRVPFDQHDWVVVRRGGGDQLGWWWAGI